MNNKKNINFNYLSSNKAINISVLVFVIIKTIISIIKINEYRVASIIDVINFHYVAPVGYKVTLVAFLIILFVNIEHYFNIEIFLRNENRTVWFKSIIKTNLILSILFSFMLLIVPIIVYCIYYLGIFDLSMTYTIVVRTILNIISYNFFGLIYIILRMIINKSIYAVIVEILGYLTINEALGYIYINSDVMENLFYVPYDSISITHIFHSLILLVITQGLMYLGEWYNLKRNILKGAYENE
jgi:hypothetical protein